MIKKIFVILFSILLVASLTSCEDVQGLAVVNNTGEEITVVSIDSPRGETPYAETPYVLANGQTTGIRTPYRLRIDRWGKKSWFYNNLRPVPNNMTKRVAVGVYMTKFQIEKDGTVYVVMPGSTGVATNFPPQPPPYPIRPK